MSELSRNRSVQERRVECGRIAAQLAGERDRAREEFRRLRAIADEAERKYNALCQRAYDADRDLRWMPDS